MNTLVRSATTSLSRRLNGYEPLDHYYDAFNRPENLGRRTASKPRNMSAHPGMASFGYRVAKAKQRQMFLQSYKLASRSKLRRSRSGKLKKVVVKPEIPRYNVDRFDVNAFNVQQDFSLHAEFVVTVKSDNPNQHIGFQYGKDSSVVVTYRDSILCAGTLPTFLQPQENTTMIQILLKGESEFGSGLQEALMQNRKTGKIPLLVEVKAPISVVVHDFPMRQVTVLLNCSLVVDNLSPKKKARILSSTYQYAVAL
ncbi:hypothetical protein GH714_016514 [Hevea brasiliensis]|uniref:Late embryogenesis abundant protein LEA-2 subgroup domain-containing protein n=1 Tax=Hevea brasiliensis TaxID=3981 RepID=A0A6A6M537_HEVBR|nr:hypothetical protein GH714_016514 [Hevea brasiliensis]